MTRCLFIAVFLLTVAAVCTAQTPSAEQREKIETEEIKLNMAAFDRNGNFIPDVKSEDLVIIEDGRLHQANSVRSVTASVLIAMDNGGEARQSKSIGTTRSVAARVVGGLRADTNIALLQFHNKVEFLSGWRTDKNELDTMINNRTTFGNSSSFSMALNSIMEFFGNAPTENRHLVLITDGLDSPEDIEGRQIAIRKLWESGIVVHVISYTQMEYQAFEPQARIWREGEQNPKRMPEEVLEQLAHAIPARRNVAKDVIKQIYQPRLYSIIIDKPFLRNKKAHLKNLATSQIQLSALADYTGGEFVLPASADEMLEKSARVSESINSRYIISYSPKRPLKPIKADEIRYIEVSSRRAGLDVHASRRLVVFANETSK